jgi:hypothetical protein
MKIKITCTDDLLRKKIFISRFVSFLCSKREADAQNVIGFGGFIGKRSADAEAQFGHGFGHGGFGHGGFGGHRGGFGGHFGKRSANAEPQFGHGGFGHGGFGHGGFGGYYGK